MDRKRKLERISGGYYIVSILDGIEKIRQLSEELNKTGRKAVRAAGENADPLILGMLSDYKGHTEALTGLGTQLEQMSDHLLRAADISVEAEDMAAEVLRRLLDRREGEQGYER